MSMKQTTLWTALVTPFTADASAVDYATLKTLLKRQEAAGAGVLILGSTGESLALSDEEKCEIVKFTFAQKLSVPIMIGTPNINLAHALDWISFCRGQGADAYLAATPSYSKPGPQGQLGWFTKILDACDAPVMLYNVPSRTGASLSSEVLRTLQNHKNFWAVKESSGGVDAYNDYASAAPKVALFCGDDPIMASAAPLGACGLVSVASNMWPEACAAYVNACLKGTYNGTEWHRISKALFMTTSPVPVKAIMQARGIMPSAMVRLPLSTKDLANIDALNAADQLVNEWYRAKSKEKAA